jgi:CelD/BcsL family acetyltransferase involved in cellulose biosynthesis
VARVSRRCLETAPALSPDVWLRPPLAVQAFPFDSPHCRLHGSPASALRHGIRALALAPGSAVLVPVHHDPALVGVLLGCRLGVTFYDEDRELAPDEADLDRRATPATRALMLVHQLGFAQDLARWRGVCDARGWALIEDATQAWPASVGSTAAGAAGELAVFSMAQALGWPDVAALHCSASAAPSEDAAQRHEAGRAASLHAQWLARRVALPGLGRRAIPAHVRVSDVAAGRAAGAPPAAVGSLLARLADPAVAAARRAHYATFLDALGDRVAPPFARVPEGASPALFPIRLDDRAHTAERLARMGIATGEVWSMPHPSLDEARTRAVLRRRASSLGLPVHQELRPDDVERIVGALRGPRRAVEELRVESLASLEAAHAACGELAARAGNVFATFEWMSAWCTHAPDGGSLLLCACREAGGDVVGLLPLVTRREGALRVVRLLGHGPADRLAPVCAPVDRPRVARALRRVLHASGCDLFVGDQMPAEEGWGPALGATLLEREANPVLHIGGMSWDDFLAHRSANFRQQVRRRERKLAREHALSYRLADDPARLGEDLDTLVRLHDDRWRDGGSIAFSGWRRELHAQFARRALDRGWLRLWLLELDGQTVAAWYGFRHGGAEWFYQSGRDRSAAGDAVGFVLLCHTIREAMNDGMREYRLLRGDEPYKARFADRDAGLQTLALALSARGRVALAARRARPPAGRAVRFARAYRAADGS